MAAFFEFFVPKECFKNDSSTSAQILFWGTIHAQSKDKQTFISKNKATPMITGLIFDLVKRRLHQKIFKSKYIP